MEKRRLSELLLTLILSSNILLIPIQAFLITNEQSLEKGKQIKTQ
jgi:hypothetical protein